MFLRNLPFGIYDEKKKKIYDKFFWILFLKKIQEHRKQIWMIEDQLDDSVDKFHCHNIILQLNHPQDLLFPKKWVKQVNISLLATFMYPRSNFGIYKYSLFKMSFLAC